VIPLARLIETGRFWANEIAHLAIETTADSKVWERLIAKRGAHRHRTCVAGTLWKGLSHVSKK
jgi:hypothetical protein